MRCTNSAALQPQIRLSALGHDNRIFYAQHLCYPKHFIISALLYETLYYIGFVIQNTLSYRLCYPKHFTISALLYKTLYYIGLKGWPWKLYYFAAERLSLIAVSNSALSRNSIDSLTASRPTPSLR
jgi:hypothetical protein